MLSESITYRNDLGAEYLLRSEKGHASLEVDLNYILINCMCSFMIDQKCREARMKGCFACGLRPGRSWHRFGSRLFWFFG